MIQIDATVFAATYVIRRSDYDVCITVSVYITCRTDRLPEFIPVLVAVVNVGSIKTG